MTSIGVRTIAAANHLAFLEERADASFLQTPAWGHVKSEWRSESIGWFRDDRLVGAALVLYRKLPQIRRFFAYLPEGPTLDWCEEDTAEVLRALRRHAQNRGAFAVRMGPLVATRRWSAQTVKAAMADPWQRRLDDLSADVSSDRGWDLQSLLRTEGWRPLTRAGFTEGQPRYVFQLPLDGRSEADLLASMNQQWRRNIKKAAKAGVKVTEGDFSDLAAFHTLYVETAARDGFTPRPLQYFQHMFAVLRGEDRDRIRLYLAWHTDTLIAATTWVRVGRHVWYSYGASSTAHRDVRGSNAIQWRMIQDALSIGATVYDMRGITETLDSEDPHIGLLQFKVGTGGEAVEYVGEWDLPINRVLYRAFDAYMRRR